MSGFGSAPWGSGPFGSQPEEEAEVVDPIQPGQFIVVIATTDEVEHVTGVEDV